MKGLLSPQSLPPGHLHNQDDRPSKESYSSVVEWVRIGFVGLVLAALIGSFMWIDYGPVAVTTPGPSESASTVPVPQLDPAILAKVKEADRVQRIQVESGPFLHLLEAARNVVPSVAKALGMPDQMVPVTNLQQRPERFRGKWLWYKGQLEEKPRARFGEASTAYSVFEARIRTISTTGERPASRTSGSAGEPVLFAFSVKPDEKLDKGSWVRIEGFFLKLRDMNTPVVLDQAPMLVGAELQPDFADWSSVEKLDREVLARVRDGRVMDGALVEDGGDSSKAIDDAQTLPLWHLASFAKHEWAKTDAEKVLAMPKFVTKEQWDSFVRRNTPKGELVGILGSIQKVRTLDARPNPAGIEHWSEAWVQVRELRGRLVPLWIPKHLPPFRIGEAVYTAGYFYKVCVYTSVENEEHATPLFVAADLLRYELPDSPYSYYLWVPILAFLLALIGATYWYARREGRQELVMEKAIVNLRRRRRGAAPIGGAPVTDAPVTDA
jgi:hypothetical protein